MPVVRTSLSLDKDRFQIFVINANDLLKEELTIEVIEEEFRQFLHGLRNHAGFQISKKLKEYIAEVKKILDNIEKTIKQEQQRSYYQLKLLEQLVKKELEKRKYIDEEFLEKQKEIIRELKSDIKKNIKSKRWLRKGGIFNLLKKRINVRTVKQAIENKERMAQMGLHEELKVRDHILHLLDNIEEYGKEKVINDVLHLLIGSEQIVKYSMGVQIELDKEEAKRLAMLDYYIKAFSRIAHKYGIYEEVQILRQLKNRFRLFMREDLRKNRNLGVFVNQINNQHKELVKEVKNYRFLYTSEDAVKQFLAVKRAFITANDTKNKLDLDNNFNLGRSRFIGAYRRIFAQVKEYSDDKLNREVGWHPRINLYKECKWTVETVHIRDMGVWHGAGGIQHFFTSGNLVETAKKLNYYIYGKGNVEWPDDIPRRLFKKPSILKKDYKKEHKKISKYNSIRQHADIIYQLFPIILIENGFRAEYIDGGWDIKKAKIKYTKTKYDVDDGNHRAISFAMFGITEIKCFVGRH